MIPCVDVSEAQSPINWKAHKAAGFTSVIVRCGEGFADDSRYVVHARGAHAVGLPVIAYHFANFAQDPVLQAEHSVAFVRATGVPVVRAMIDLESASAPQPIPHTWLDGYFRVFDQAFDNPCGVATAAYWWNPHVPEPWRYAERPFILSQWPTPTVTPPSDPAKWAEWAYARVPAGPHWLSGIPDSSIAGWQFSAIGVVAGIPVPEVVDCDLIFDPTLFLTKEFALPSFVRRASDGSIDITDGPSFRHLKPLEWAMWERRGAKYGESLTDAEWDEMHGVV